MKIAYVEQEDRVTVLRCYGTDPVAELPEQIGGKPVRELSDHIFAASRSTEYSPEKIRIFDDAFGEPPAAGADGMPELVFPEEVILPDTIESIGNYAFYGCRTLHRLTLPSRLARLGRGVFTACNHIEEIRFFETSPIPENGIQTPQCMRNILGELEYEFRISLRIGEAVRWSLLFPGYYEESIENTPARIIEIKYEGTGYKYRQCIRGGMLDLGQYDRLFYLARVQERAQTSVQIALLRLAFPEGLGEDSKEAYLDFLKDEDAECAAFVLHSDDCLLWLETLVRERYFSRELLEKWMNRLGEKEDARALSLLMDYRRREFPAVKKQFVL